MKTPNYTVTREEWETLQSLADKAEQALNALKNHLLLLPKEDDKTRLFLLDLADCVPSLGKLTPCMLHVQPEWTGGDSRDPKNTRYREPHVVGNFPGHVQ